MVGFEDAGKVTISCIKKVGKSMYICMDELVKTLSITSVCFPFFQLVNVVSWDPQTWFVILGLDSVHVGLVL